MRSRLWLGLAASGLGIACFAACSGNPELKVTDGTSGSGGQSGQSGSSSGGGGGTGPAAGSGGSINVPDGGCEPQTCADLGWACGYTLICGEIVNCADEGLSCGGGQVCVGGVDGPTQCVSGSTETCDLCPAIPDCTNQPAATRLTGRVVSPGRTDGDTENQVGIPNAVVYILRNNDPTALPEIASGIPSGETSCDRCEDQDLGPVLAGTVTDASGNWVLETNVPVGAEFVLVVKAGKFRRAVKYTLPAAAACQTTELTAALPDNPTRLARDMTDGLAVNIPRIAVSTGQLDAMECVFAKMGLSVDEFGNPGADGSGAARVHLYRGGANTGTPPGAGARIDDQTPHDSALYDSISRLELYDMIVADCEGQSWDQQFTQRNASGANLREYVNRGGRMFASHLSFSWLHENGTDEYVATAPVLTGLGPAATWTPSAITGLNTGTGIVSLDRAAASPRIENFADWMVNEGVTTAPLYQFTINEPRSQVQSLGPSSEEFVYCEGGDCTENNVRTQQFSFNTPYGAPAEASCGRVAYSGFHVTVGNASNAIFPNHCTGTLTDQEKVLLYMLFDLGACVGIPEPPSCVPETCQSLGAKCGYSPDGCGAVLDCGPCRPPS
jgi:hypothetical protein